MSNAFPALYLSTLSPPVLSDDGSIDKVWIGMAGRFGSV